MNTYSKYCPNVFCAKCEQKHEKGDIITMTTKYGAEHDAIVFNLLLERDGFYYYSVVRADGFNRQEWAKRRAEKLEKAARNAQKKADAYREAANEGHEFLRLGEPIKVGHHSEKRHRALIERNHNRMNNWVKNERVAQSYEERSEYWEARANEINLSMPESLEFYEFKLEKEKEIHEGLKSGKINREHSYSLTYAKKAVNEAEKNLKIAQKLWA
jgi:hypothetical protein